MSFVFRLLGALGKGTLGKGLWKTSLVQSNIALSLSLSLFLSFFFFSQNNIETVSKIVKLACLVWLPALKY